jgi:hypothetical protein
VEVSGRRKGNTKAPHREVGRSGRSSRPGYASFAPLSLRRCDPDQVPRDSLNPVIGVPLAATVKLKNAEPGSNRFDGQSPGADGQGLIRYPTAKGQGVRSVLPLLAGDRASRWNPGGKHSVRSRPSMPNVQRGHSLLRSTSADSCRTGIARFLPRLPPRSPRTPVRDCGCTSCRNGTSRDDLRTRGRRGRAPPCPPPRAPTRATPAYRRHSRRSPGG